MEEVKQKMVEALKDLKIDEFKNCSVHGKMSQWVNYIKWRVPGRWLKFKHVKINSQFL